MRRGEKNPSEYGNQTRLSDLKQEYMDIKRTAEELLENKNKSEADKMEQQARIVAAEIIKLDPNFAKNLDSFVEQTFKAESDELNRTEHGTDQNKIN